jgi:hypothetical protein
VIPYRKFSDTLKDEVCTPTPPKPPNAAKVAPAGSTEAQTLGALGGLGARAPSGEFCNPPASAWTDAQEERAAIVEFDGGATGCATASMQPIAKKPRATGPWELLIQKWGGSIKEAAEVVNSLCDAAGAPGTWRRDHVGELFTKMQAQHRWNGRRKIEWLVYVADKMQRLPMWWPASRPDLAALGREGRDAILRVMKRRPKGHWPKAELQRATGKSEAAISSLVLSMCAAGEIDRVAPGVFALPRSGVRRYVPVSVAIINALLEAADHQAMAMQLAATIGVTRNAVNSAANRMVEAGLLVRPKRGVFALSPETLRKIERGDVLRVGKKMLVLSQLSMWPALDK